MNHTTVTADFWAFRGIDLEECDLFQASLVLRKPLYTYPICMLKLPHRSTQTYSVPQLSLLLYN